MKKVIMLTVLAVSFVLAGYSQTNQTPTLPWWSTPLLANLGHTNGVGGTYAMYDSTDNSWGGGLFLGYKLNEFVVPIVRLDYVREEVFAASVSIQLQAPQDIFHGHVRITPLAYACAATSWNNNDNTDNGNAIGIFGTGLAVSFQDIKKWWLPSGIVVTAERWTGSGFNDDQFRIGPYWKL